MGRQLTQALIEQWVSEARGTFYTRDIWAEREVVSQEGRAYLRVVLERLCKSGIISHTEQDGKWRKVENTRKPMEFEGVDPRNVVNLSFPFELEAYAKIFPKSIIIIAGGKNAGKTAFLYNFIHDNVQNHIIDLYNSETGPEQMVERLDAFPDMPRPYPFGIWEQYDNFADVIDPDNISVIDYLDLNSEFYLLGAEIDAIFRKLNKGVAVIAIQKPPATITFVKGVKKVVERDLGYGGGPTAKRSSLYISMSANDGGQSGKLKLVYVKNPSQRGVNPNNMTWTYKVGDDGVHFENIQRYYEFQGEA